ncbi:hypothetical protein [Bradyrhizobium sp. DASA03007]|uniref:hypothetical protein n=1 Tax=unclassified Bradyrhizobium TaxID=2631580 RepID=UPI003F6FBA93
MSEAHEQAIQAEKDPANLDKERPVKGGVAAKSDAIKSAIEVVNEFGKLLLIMVVLGYLRAAVECYASGWLESANKLGFLGWSIERQASAERAVAEILKDKPTLTDAKFAEGAIERAARNAPAIVGSRILWVSGFSDLERQLAYRFALDGVSKHRRWYNEEYFFGTAIIDQFTEPFEAKSFYPRASL